MKLGVYANNLIALILVLLVSCGGSNGQTEKYPDGTTKTEYKLKDGKRDGLVKGYYPDGKIQYEANFKMGVQDGSTIVYYENGNKQKEMYFKDGVQQDTMKAYYENGNLQEVSLLKNGAKEGKYLGYREDGKLKLEGQVMKGVPSGQFKVYSKDVDGKVVGIINYNETGEMTDALSMISIGNNEYASNFLGFKMTIPKDWEIGSQESVYVLFRPQGSEEFNGTVNVVKTRYNNTTFNETVDLDIQKMQETMSGFKVLEKEIINSSGFKGYRVIYTAEIKSIPIKSLVMYIDKRESECYLITCISKQELFEQYQTEAFTNMVESFTLDNYGDVVGEIQAYLN